MVALVPRHVLPEEPHLRKRLAAHTAHVLLHFGVDKVDVGVECGSAPEALSAICMRTLIGSNLAVCSHVCVQRVTGSEALVACGTDEALLQILNDGFVVVEKNRNLGYLGVYDFIGWIYVGVGLILLGITINHCSHRELEIGLAQFGVFIEECRNIEIGQAFKRPCGKGELQILQCWWLVHPLRSDGRVVRNHHSSVALMHHDRSDGKQPTHVHGRGIGLGEGNAYAELQRKHELLSKM